jgi:hypothetical protein
VRTVRLLLSGRVDVESFFQRLGGNRAGFLPADDESEKKAGYHPTNLTSDRIENEDATRW